MLCSSAMISQTKVRRLLSRLSRSFSPLRQKNRSCIKTKKRDTQVCVPYKIRFAKTTIPQHVGAAHQAARVLICSPIRVLSKVPILPFAVGINLILRVNILNRIFGATIIAGKAHLTVYVFPLNV